MGRYSDCIFKLEKKKVCNSKKKICPILSHIKTEGEKNKVRKWERK